MSLFENRPVAPPPEMTDAEAEAIRAQASDIVAGLNRLSGADAMTLLDLVVADQITRPSPSGKPLNLSDRVALHLRAVAEMSGYIARLRELGRYNGPSDIKE